MAAEAHDLSELNMHTLVWPSSRAHVMHRHSAFSFGLRIRISLTLRQHLATLATQP